MYVPIGLPVPIRTKTDFFPSIRFRFLALVVQKLYTEVAREQFVPERFAGVEGKSRVLYVDCHSSPSFHDNATVYYAQKKKKVYGLIL